MSSRSGSFRSSPPGRAPKGRQSNRSIEPTASRTRPDPWRNGALVLAPSAGHPSTPALMSRSKRKMKMNSLVAAVPCFYMLNPQAPSPLQAYAMKPKIEIVRPTATCPQATAEDDAQKCSVISVAEFCPLISVPQPLDSDLDAFIDSNAAKNFEE